MSKCRKTWSCAFKAWNTTGNAHPAKTDAATASANSACDASSSAEAAAMEAAATEPSSAPAIIGSYERLVRYGEKKDANQAKCCFCFHTER
jgi:hypothetical protein